MTNTGNVRQGMQTRTAFADSDLSAKANHFVTPDTTDDDIVNVAADGSANSYVLVEGADGSSERASVTIALGGTAFVKLGGTVENGAFIMPTTGGEGITATDGNYYGAQALREGVDGDVIPVRIVAGYLETT